MDVRDMTFNQLNNEEQQVFYDYKQSSFNFNTRIRAGENPSKALILDALINKYESSEIMDLYRALPLNCIRENIDIYNDSTYLSCSVDKDSVFKFCTETEMAILNISCPIGIHMIDMNVNPELWALK